MRRVNFAELLHFVNISPIWFTFRRRREEYFPEFIHTDHFNMYDVCMKNTKRISYVLEIKKKKKFTMQLYVTIYSCSIFQNIKYVQVDVVI